MNQDDRVDSAMTAILSSAAERNWTIVANPAYSTITINGQTLSGADATAFQQAMQKMLELGWMSPIDDNSYNVTAVGRHAQIERFGL